MSATDMPAGLMFEAAPEAPETFNVLRPSDTQRFWDKIDRRGPNECWPWTGGVFSTGYGAFWLRGQNVGAHRVACAMSHGLSAGRLALHSCDNPPCCNPAHLRWGTPADNMEDRTARDRAPRGTGHGQARLTDEQVAEMRQLHAAGIGTPTLGRRFGVSTQTAWVIVTGKGWTR